MLAAIATVHRIDSVNETNLECLGDRKKASFFFVLKLSWQLCRMLKGTQAPGELMSHQVILTTAVKKQEAKTVVSSMTKPDNREL